MALIIPAFKHYQQRSQDEISLQTVLSQYFLQLAETKMPDYDDRAFFI